jgi:Holliday junction resolvase-like predicted endonuclease
MSRFDPNTYPDRLAFEAAARQIRSNELARLFAAAVAWLESHKGKLAGQARTFVVATAGQAHRHSAR